MLTFTLADERDIALFLSRLEAGIAEAQAADFLRSRGYRVAKDTGEDWLSPRKLSRALGFNPNWLASLLSRGIVPPGLELHRGGSGRRLMAVRPSAEFRAWAENRRKET
jgi:hypothetical protein